MALFVSYEALQYRINIPNPFFMKLILIVLFELVVGITHAQNQVIDSLITKLNENSKIDTTKVFLLNSISYNICGISPTKAFDYSEKALRIARELNYSKGIADSYRGISYSYYARTDNDKSMQFALLALKEYELCNLPEGISWSYGTIGLSYLLGLNLDKAKYYFKLSLTLNEKIGNKKGIARDINNIGLVAESRKDYDTALYYYQQALGIWDDLGYQSNLALGYINIGSIYEFQGHYRLSWQYLRKALTLTSKTNNKDHIALINQYMGEVCYKTGKYKEGEAYLKVSLRIANEIKNKKREEQTYDALTGLEVSRKNYQAAFQYLKNADRIRDTLYTQERIRQISDLETQYKTEKKEKEIQLLEQKTKIQTLWRNSLAAGLILIIIAASIIYLLQRSRTRNAKKLLDIQQLLNKKMQEMDKVKSRFFANISHEFRTPLTLIITPVEEKLQAEELSEKDKISFQIIRRNASRLLELINQLLELSKIETGHLKLQMQAGDLSNFMMPVLSSFDSLADVSFIKYTKDIRIPALTVLFDSDKLEKIINNLLSNAFKFSPKSGSVEIKAVSTETEKSVELTIEIKNYGSVIPIDIIDEIFVPFYQGSTSSWNGIPGTGLGLSLTKELVKLHHGDIRVTSDAVEGTVFTVMIMLEKSTIPQVNTAVEKAAISYYPLSGNVPVEMDSDKETVLIVEDNDDVRALIRKSLEIQYNIHEASTGHEGLKLSLDQTIDLVISDLMMPGMDGIELCNRLKNDERTSHIPVILLTARADLESKLEGLQTGADDYVVKPFNMKELLVRIFNLIEQRKKLKEKYHQRIVVQPHEITVTSLDERFIQKVIQLIENNLEDVNLSVEKMATDLGMSRNNILRKLKAITGLSTSEFIQDYRLRRAAQLIEKRADTISQIAYRVGFNDQSYFTKCFKKKFGKTPSEFSACDMPQYTA